MKATWRSQKRSPRNQRSQIKRTDLWEVLIIRDVRTSSTRRIEEGS